MDDHELLCTFLAHRVDPAVFSHRDHVRVAWLLIERFPLENALQRFEAGARDLATRAGVPEKYHVTITRALMQIIAADQARGAGQSCAEYCASNPPVLQDALSVLLRHYSKDRIFSDAARTTWCEPDLVPLPIPTAAPVLRSA